MSGPPISASDDTCRCSGPSWQPGEQLFRDLGMAEERTMLDSDLGSQQEQIRGQEIPALHGGDAERRYHKVIRLPAE